jgi:hypothetical protein
VVNAYLMNPNCSMHMKILCGAWQWILWLGRGT